MKRMTGALRRKKLDALRAHGVEPFGVAFEPDGTNRGVRERFMRARSYARRPHHCASRHGQEPLPSIFVMHRAHSIYIHAKEVGADLIDLFQLLDIAISLGSEGTCFLTKRRRTDAEGAHVPPDGESFAALPEKWHGLQDIEARYRQRLSRSSHNERSRLCLKNAIAIVR